ncbi:MAG: Rab family GTPase [Candidatus Njordarchaeota archaeon]
MSSKPRVARLKIVFLGDGAVGKTSIARRYLGETFKGDYRATIGADFYVKKDIYTFPEIGTFHFQWQIFDLAGQPTFKQVRPIYYQRAKAAIVVFDVSRPETFYSIPEWLKEFWTHAGGVYPFILVGNKIDLRGIQPCLEPRHGQKYAEILSQRLGFPIPYVETSAKTGYNVEEAFRTLAYTLASWIIRSVRSKR